MRPSPAVLLPVLALSALVACTGGQESDEAAPTSSAAQTSEQRSPTAPSPTDSPRAAGPGQVPRPAPDSCEPVPESTEGRYDLGDAGVVTLRRQDFGGLTVDVESSGGWSTSVTSRTDQAEIEFTRGEEELDFEAEVENDRLVLRICADDDD